MSLESPLGAGCWPGRAQERVWAAGRPKGEGKEAVAMETENKINSSCRWVRSEVVPGQGRVPHPRARHPGWPPARGPLRALVTLPRSGHGAVWAKKTVPGRNWGELQGLGTAWRWLHGTSTGSHPDQPLDWGILPYSSPSTDITAAFSPRPGTGCGSPGIPAPQSHPSIHPSIRPSVLLPVPVPVPRALAPAAVAGASLRSRSPSECGSSPGTGFISRRRT